MGKSVEQTTRVVNLKAPPIYIVIVTQFLVSVFAALLSWLVLDIVAAYSALLGGLICTLPNSYFARKVFQHRGASRTAEIIKSFYKGESGKLAMVALMFALVFAGVKPLNELVVMLSFIVTIIAGMIATTFVNFKPGA